MSFNSKTAVITGAASGLGKAIATALVREHANVILFDLNKARLDTTLSDLQSTSAKGKVATVAGDITNQDDIAHAISTAQSMTGSLDIVVNSAGIMDAFEPAGALARETWDRVIGVNLTGAYLTTHAAINAMLSNSVSGGVILNVASVAGVKGGTAGAAYTASKHGMLGLTKNTSVFYAKKGIRCNAIMPGGMATNIAESVPGGQQSIQGEHYAVVQANTGAGMEMCDVESVARMAVGMCAAECLNGACVPVDNGWMAN